MGPQLEHRVCKFVFLQAGLADFLAIYHRKWVHSLNKGFVNLCFYKQGLRRWVDWCVAGFAGLLGWWISGLVGW